MSKPLFKPLRTKRAYEYVSDQIVELIYSGFFKPGSKLPCERELSSQFGTGRMVIREALRVLESSGHIYIRRGSKGGAFIKKIDSMVVKKYIGSMIKVGDITIQDLTEARLRIESVIIELAVQRITNDELNLLKKNIADTEQQILKGIRPSDNNLNFHLLLAKSSKNPLFEVIIESIMWVMRSFLLSMYPGIEYVERVLDYHKKIYKAIEARNLKMTKRIMDEHIQDINRKFLKSTKLLKGKETKF